MKPGVDLACTAVLPQALAVANKVSATALSVARPETISTKAISGAGLKKCRPARRAGRFSAAPARSPNCSTAIRRWPADWAASALSLPFSASLANWARMPSTALAAAPGRLSSSLTTWPACAATWAMPAPMAPVPTTAMMACWDRGAWLTRSLSGEFRCAFFHEGLDALGIVRAPAQLAHEAAFEGQLLLQGVARRGMHGLAGTDQRLGRHHRQLLGQRIDTRRKIGVLGAFPDQPPFGGLFGRQLVGEQGQAHGAGHADALRQEPGATGIRNQADLGEGLQEGSGLGRNHQVTGQRHRGASTGGNAIDRSNGRHTDRKSVV